ncbi:MAG: hypothetical protein AAB402_01510 [Patescibacteria group bacterium]
MHLASPKPAQTLLEAVLAIGVILVATISATTLIVTTISAGQSSEDKIVAANLAREGVEIMRGIRDSNWMRQSQNVLNSSTGTTFAWDDNPYYDSAADTVEYIKLGASGAGNVFIAVYGASRMTLMPLAAAASDVVQGSLAFLAQNCDSGCTPTKFSRRITVSTPSDTFFPGVDVTYLLVTSTVTWNNHGDKKYIATERLYDWR